MKKYLLVFLFILSQVPICAQTAGQLTVTVTTSTAGGSYKPKSDDAIWIEDSSGKFVKTLVGCTSGDKSDLTYWKAATTSTYNTVDAVTSATRSSYGQRTGTWNGTNTATPRVVVIDGTYTVKIEMTDGSGSTGKLAAFTFTKGPLAVTLTPANQTVFSNITAQWVPVATGIDELKLSDLYTAYPNPTTSTLFINGLDIKEIELCTLSGKSIFKTPEQRISLRFLPKGIYLAKVKTGKGVIIKKIIKE